MYQYKCLQHSNLYIQHLQTHSATVKHTQKLPIDSLSRAWMCKNESKDKSRVWNLAVHTTGTCQIYTSMLGCSLHKNKGQIKILFKFPQGLIQYQALYMLYSLVKCGVLPHSMLNVCACSVCVLWMCMHSCILHAWCVICHGSSIISCSIQYSQCDWYFTLCVSTIPVIAGALRCLFPFTPLVYRWDSLVSPTSTGFLLDSTMNIITQYGYRQNGFSNLGFVLDNYIHSSLPLWYSRIYLV